MGADALTDDGDQPKTRRTPQEMVLRAMHRQRSGPCCVAVVPCAVLGSKTYTYRAGSVFLEYHQVAVSEGSSAQVGGDQLDLEIPRRHDCRFNRESCFG